MNFNAGTELERIFGAVLEATELASILIVLVAVVQWIAGKRLGPSWRFALWGIVLVRLLVPIAPESRWSVFNAAQWLAREKTEPAVTMEVEPATLVVPEMAGEAVEVRFPTEAPTFASESEVGTPLPWWVIGMSVWGVGLAWFLGRLLVGSWWLRRRIRRSVREAGREGTASNLDAALESAALEMRTRRRFRVVETGVVNSPALFGMLRPQLLVPRGFAEQLNAQELRHVLLHELAHVKRWDLITNWLMAVAQAVHWFNPLVWVTLRQMRVERELACDEMVLRATSGAGMEEGRAYGETILRLLEGVNSRRSLPALVGIAEEKHSARKRMKQIAAFDARKRNMRWMGIALVSLMGMVGLTNAQIKKAQDAGESETAMGRPSLETETSKPDVAANHSKMVNDARLFLEMGRLDEAGVKLQEVLKADPEHRAAFYYSKLVEDRWIAQEQRTQEAMSQPELKLLPFGQGQTEIIQIADRPPNPYARTNRVYVGRGRQEIIRKVNEMVIDYYEVPNELELSEVIKDIHRLARKLDPEKNGVNFVISSHLENPGAIESKASLNPFAEQPPAPLKLTDPVTISPALKVGDYVVKISPALRNVTMLGLINAIVEVAEPPKGNDGAPRLMYSVEDYAIVFGQRLREAESLYTRTFKIDPNTFIQGLQPEVDINQVLQGNGADRGARVQQAVKEFFTAAGISFGAMREFNALSGGTATAQKAIFFNDRTGVLMARVTKAELAIIEKALQTMIGEVPEQVMISVDVMEVKSREEFDILFRTLADQPATQRNPRGFRTALTTLAFRTIEKAAVNGGFVWLKLPRVTTTVGRAARIIQEKVVSVDVTCEYQKGDKTFKVTASTNDSNNGKSGSQEAVVFDGQTMVLLPKVDGDAVTPGRVIFITPELIDAAGNIINKGNDHFIKSIELEVPEQ